MTIGEKIRRIRRFRKMTQVQLGEAVGLGENAQNRIAHYERGTRVPQKKLLDDMAKVLDVNPHTLYEATGEDNSELLQILFWLEESNPGVFHLFRLHQFSVEEQHDDCTDGAYYRPSDAWPATPPVGIWFFGTNINSYLREWQQRMKERDAGEISKEEYFEWKINWPDTCDDCGIHEPAKRWRKVNQQYSIGWMKSNDAPKRG